MNPTVTHRLSDLARGATAGWIALLAFLAVYFFVIPHDPNFATPIGPLASYLFFSGLVSMYYLTSFSVLLVPVHFLLRNKTFHLYQSFFIGGSLLGIGFFLSSMIVSGLNSDNTVHSAVFGGISGALASKWLFRTKRPKAKDPDYASSITVTPEKIIASLLVLIWIGSAWRIGGLQLGVRAVLFFMIPLSFVWIPECMSSIAGMASRKSLAADVPMLPNILRGVGWIVIVGVPAVWMLFALSVKK